MDTTQALRTMLVDHTPHMLCSCLGRSAGGDAANLAREVAAKQAEGRALQRRWAARQAELVGLAQARAPAWPRGTAVCGVALRGSLTVLGTDLELTCDTLTASACACLSLEKQHHSSNNCACEPSMHIYSIGDAVQRQACEVGLMRRRPARPAARA